MADDRHRPAPAGDDPRDAEVDASLAYWLRDFGLTPLADEAWPDVAARVALVPMFRPWRALTARALGGDAELEIVAPVGDLREVVRVRVPRAAIEAVIAALARTAARGLHVDRNARDGAMTVLEWSHAGRAHRCLTDDPPALDLGGIAAPLLALVGGVPEPMRSEVATALVDCGVLGPFPSRRR